MVAIGLSQESSDDGGQGHQKGGPLRDAAREPLCAGPRRQAPRAPDAEVGADQRGAHAVALAHRSAHRRAGQRATMRINMPLTGFATPNEHRSLFKRRGSRRRAKSVLVARAQRRDARVDGRQVLRQLRPDQAVFAGYGILGFANAGARRIFLFQLSARIAAAARPRCLGLLEQIGHVEVLLVVLDIGFKRQRQFKQLNFTTLRYYYITCFVHSPIARPRPLLFLLFSTAVSAVLLPLLPVLARGDVLVLETRSLFLLLFVVIFVVLIVL